MNTKLSSFFRAFLLLAVSSVHLSSNAQNPEDFKIITIENNKSYISSIEISPDKKTLAIATGGNAIFFWDIETQKITRKLDLAGYKQGPYLAYSADGKYLLLLQQFFTDWSLNKDRPSKAEVMDVATGNILLSKEGVHCASFTPDSKSVLALDGGEVVFWNILSGEKERSFKPDNATNSVAINPAGDMIVVSQKTTEEELKNIPSVRSDKKAIKEALKYRELAVFYDAKTFAKKFVADDIFDIVFSIRFSLDGSLVYLFNAPNTHLRAQQGASRNGYIQVVDATNGSATRLMYSTSASEPLYKESADRNYFACTSIEQKFRVLNSINLFDRATGSMLKYFVNDFRVFEDIHIGRASFEFLPGDETMMLGYGSRLALWKFQK